MCEGGTAGLEAKALVWNVKSQYIFCVEAELRTSEHYSLCGSGIPDFKVTQFSMCGRGTAELKSLSIFLVQRRNCGTAGLKTKDIPCAEAELRELKSQHILCVEAELWNFKSQNILCAEAELQVTEYSKFGISLVPCAMVRKTRERRAAGPWVKAILVVLLFTGGGFFVFSIIIKQ